MPVINFIDGEKGGVGKSLFARCLLHYFEENHLPYTLVDADTNADVAQVYPGGIKEINFRVADEVTAMNSRQAADVDRIFELAKDKAVIINLPANVHHGVTYWIKENDLLEGEIVKQAGVSLCKWFLCSGSYDSVTLFLNSLATFEGKLSHILVRNYGLCPDWSNVDKRQQFQEAKEKYQFEEVNFPGLRFTERDYLEENRIPFAKAIAEKSKMPALSRQRLIKFLRHYSQGIEAVSLINKLHPA